MSRGPAALIAFVIAGVLVILALAGTEAGQFILSGGSFTRSVDVDRGTYFRLKVKLAYKGEPQDFDIVVGCNVRVTTYRDNSSTYEAGLTPTLFGRRMGDGAAVVVRAPDACRGQTTANGKVPSEFIPLIIVYDDADTMGFGTAYVTDDAYHSPLTALKFGGATVEESNRAEFEVFRAEQPNAVRPEMYFSDSPPELEKRGLKMPAVMFGQRCYGYARFRLIGKEKEAAQRLWPKDHPQYWRPTPEEISQIDPTMPRPQTMQTDHANASPRPRRALSNSLEYAADFGVATHSGTGLINLHGFYPASVYPDVGAWGHLPWPSDPAKTAERIMREGPRIGASIDFRGGATRGFAYCRSDPEEFPTSERSNSERLELRHFMAMSGHDLVDEKTVSARKWMGYALRIVERDEFLFDRFLISIDSTRGDV